MSRTSLEELFSGDVLSVAEGLLGWTLESTIGGATTSITLTETEAYAGADDPASHAFRGTTKRNGAMFGVAGTLYVYRSYGIHWCMNVVVGEEGLPHAVLLRGGEPIVGVPEMVKRRGRSRDLANGPGKLCQALGVTGDHDATDVRLGPIKLLPGPGVAKRSIVRTPRIGISKAVDRQWRFLVV